MRTLNLSGFQHGNNLNISVSQGAITAGPVNVPAWGGAVPTGDITINVERTRVQAAPDSVRFSVDLSLSDFDTPGPVGNEVYDARMHDLIYLWDFDDASTGDWTAPVNVLAGWKNRNEAKGPWVAHMYTQPGTYNPSVLVIEPSSGKTATAVATVEVLDPADAYPGANTVCISTSGNYAGAPGGATTITLTDLTAATLAAYGPGGAIRTPKRLLLRRGETFNMQLNVGGFGDLHIGTFGTGAKPLINVPNSDLAVSNTTYHQASVFVSGGFGNNQIADLRIDGVKFLGDFDPTIEVDAVRQGQPAGQENAPWAVTGVSHVDLMLSQVDYEGIFAIASMNGSNVDYRVHLDDCSATKIGGNYPLFIGPSNLETTTGVLTGCRIAQPSGAHDTNLTAFSGKAPKSAGTHSPVRWNQCRRVHMRGCDFFHTDRVHYSLRLNSQADRDGQITNIHSMAMEGGGGMLTFAGERTNGNNRSVVSNAIFDGMIYVGAYGTIGWAETFSTGMTFRNCVTIIPSVLRNSEAAFKHWFVMKTYGTYDQTVVGDAPVKIYNNTFVFLMSPVENRNNQIGTIRDDSGGLYTALSWENNVQHQPNYSIQVIDEFAPLETTTPLWTPRNTGLRFPDTLFLDTSYATPIDTVKSYKPLPGSAALGAALTGNVSYMDILGTTRTAPADKGAWEVA